MMVSGFDVEEDIRMARGGCKALAFEKQPH
jgi:hypothetical protein